VRGRCFYVRRGKRCFDLAVSMTGLILLWVPMGVIGLLTYLIDGSPVIYRQNRIGRYGQVFTIYKFRTMRSGHANTSSVTVAGDERVTRLGGWLRRFKLDELPQLFNVLKGDMSFVGPRPDVAGYMDRLEGPARSLLTLRPGITGPATLAFRNEEELLARANSQSFNDEVLFPSKVRINLEYLQRISLFEDLRLILLTIMPVGYRHPERDRVEQALQNHH